MHHKKISNYILFSLFWIFLSTTIYYFKIKDLKKDLTVTTYKYKYYITFSQSNKLQNINFIRINFRNASSEFENILYDIEKNFEKMNFEKFTILFNDFLPNKKIIIFEFDATQEIKDIDEIININTEKLKKIITLENFKNFKDNLPILSQKKNLPDEEFVKSLNLINEENLLTTEVSSTLFKYNKKTPSRFSRITIINTIFGSILFSLLLIFLYEIFLIQYNLKLKRKKK
jgi:hypothetical protein